jgi:hypothetical protein
MSYLYNSNNIGKETLVFNNSLSEQEIDATIADITGSSITYTPIQNCINVIYEVKFQSDYRPDSNDDYFFELFQSTDSGSSWSGLGNYYCIEGSTISNYKIDKIISIKFILPSYSGTRSYKLRGRSSSNSKELRLHKDTSSNEVYYPTVMMYSVL